MKNASFILTIVALVLEGVMAIPILGGTFVLASAYIPLIIAFIVHTANLVLRVKTKLSIATPIAGVVASVVAIIPFVGWVLHVVMVILLIIDLVKVDFKDEEEKNLAANKKTLNYPRLISKKFEVGVVQRGIKKV